VILHNTGIAGALWSFLLCKKPMDVPFPRPFGATGNDAQKIQASENYLTLEF
jgi:hypothetical protein